MKTASLLLILGCASIAAGDDSANAVTEAPPQTTITLHLAGGASMEAVRVERVGGLVHVELPDGRRIAFSPVDVTWSEPTKGLESAPSAVQGPVSAGELQGVARDLRLEETSIEITGEPGVFEPPSDSEMALARRFDENHDRAFSELERTAATYSAIGRRASSNIDKYLNTCLGSMEAHGSGETTGFGGFAGDGAAVYVGSSPWGRFAGVAGFTFRGWSSWHEHHEWTTEIANSDTPFCRSLASDITTDCLTLRGILLPAITQARLAGVIGAEIDKTLTTHGYAPAKFWLEE